MESIGCEDLDVIVVVAGSAAARAALSAQEGAPGCWRQLRLYRQRLPRRHIARRISVRRRVMQLKQNSAKVVGATHALDIIDARRN
jgi:hypothetical protein